MLRCCMSSIQSPGCFNNGFCNLVNKTLHCVYISAFPINVTNFVKKEMLCTPDVAWCWGANTAFEPVRFPISKYRARFFTEKENYFISLRKITLGCNISAVNLHTFYCEHIEQM